MNTRVLVTKIASLLFAGAVSAVLLNSCQKEKITKVPGTINGRTSNATDDQKREAVGIINKIPLLRVFDENDHRFIDVDFQHKKLAFKNATERDFSFATPNPGWNFSNSSQVAFVPASQGGGVLFVGPGSLGGNAGGTVVAGNSALNINYTFCFSASSSALGLDLFDTGADISGISGVIGIDGDFDALLNDEVDSTANFTDFFHGYAAYFVYANEASGSYDILNWFNDLSENTDQLNNKGFSFALDFQNDGWYLSKDGSLNVAGGTMTFSGNYFGIIGLFDSIFGSGNSPNAVEVPGFGSMGCN
jgi:hypothetical protein